MIVWLHIVATFLARFIPEGLAHCVVGWGTPAVLLFTRGYFRRAAENMRHVLGPDASPREIRRLTTAAFANYGRYMVDLLKLPHMDMQCIEKQLEVHGWENALRAREIGKGVVFVTGHIGSWDLAGATMVARGFPVSVLVETLKPDRWNERVQRIREHTGMKAIPIESGIREMLAALRRKECLAILVDRPTRDDGVPVTFFGRQTCVPGGAATLSLRTGAPVVPAVLLRNPSGKGYVAHIGEPILPPAGGKRDGAVELLTQSIMRWLEDVIREHPDQWYMFRHMWPGNEPSMVTLQPASVAAPG